MKIIFNKYGGLKTIEDRQLLVQSSDNANYVDIYYQDDAGNFADETVNLATIAFKRADSFEIMEKTCDAVREELTNKLLYFRYVFQEDDLAVNGELQITVRLKQVVFDPEDETQILLVKQRTMGKLVAHIYEAVGTDYEEYNVIDGRLLQLELWQSTFDGTYYDVTQIDAIIAQEVLNRNNAINGHNNNANAHASIREKIATNTDNIATNDERISELEGFKDGLNIDIGNRINQAVAVETNAREEALESKADLVDGKVPSTQLPSYVDDVLEYAKLADFPATGEDGKIYVAKDTNLTYRWSGSGYTEISASLALGETSSTAYAGDKGKIAYDHSQTAHAPSNAQANVIEGVQVNGVDLSVANKKVNVTVPTIPDITVNNGSAESGKYISQVVVDATDKHKLNVTKANLPQGFSGDFEDLTNVPDEFTPTAHNHDDRYYTETEVDTKLGGKANATHNHTKSEITDFPTSMTPTAHNHTKSEITDFPTSMPPTAHNHDSEYYKKSETYTKTQTDALVGNLQGQTQELKSITTQPSGTFEVGDLYYNSSTKGMYYYTGSAWELTGVGEPIAGVIYSFNGTLYFWNETEADLIQIGGGVDLSNYYTKTEIDAMFDNLLGGSY